MEYLNQITLDLSGNSPTPFVTAKQGDINSRQIIVSLTANEEPYLIPNETTARFAWHKPDGHQVLNDAEIFDNQIKIICTEQMLAATGEAYCEVMLYQKDRMLSSTVFSVCILPFVYNSEEAESCSEYDSFVKALGKTTEATKECEAAAAAAKGATKNALEAANDAKNAADAAWEAVLDDTVIYDPLSGEKNKIQTVFFHFYAWICRIIQAPITAADFDSLCMAASHYDQLNISAQAYDLQAKKILN